MSESAQSLEKTLGFIRDYRGRYASAKSNRVFLEQFRKSKKAILMEQRRAELAGKEKTTESMLENYAYSHPEYLELLDGLRVAVEQEEEMGLLVKGCWAQIEIWRTEQANNRAERSAYT